MRILLDTNVVIWAMTDDPRLSASAQELLKNPPHNVYFSVVSLWEIAIKNSIGRLGLSVGLIADSLKSNGYQRLAISDEHLNCLVNLPFHHRDPFDRILVAQAESEPLKLVTSDKLLQAYGSYVITV